MPTANIQVTSPPHLLPSNSAVCQNPRHDFSLPVSSVPRQVSQNSSVLLSYFHLICTLRNIHFHPNNYDVVLRIWGFKVYVLSPNRRSSPGSYLSLGTNAAENTKTPQSHWAHDAYKLTERRQLCEWKWNSFFKTAQPFIWIKNNFFRECSLKSLCWLR